MTQTPTGTAQRLIRAQEARLASTGLGIEPGGADELEKLVLSGAQRLDDVRASPDAIERATKNLERLIDATADAARGLGDPALTERSLREALSRLCPLFPFC